MSEERKIGRPSDYSEKIADEICDRLANGESLRSICKSEHMPHVGTVCRWLAKPENAGFREQYTRAREVQADILADETLDIADDASNDWMKRAGKDGEPGWVFNGEAARRSQIRIDARKWYAGKLAPKKYGDRQQIEHSGPDGGPVQVQRIERVVVDPKAE